MQARRELTPSEKHDARRLRELFHEEKRKTGLTQKEVGKLIGKTQGAVGHYINGHSPLNFDAIISFSLALGCRPEDIRPSLADAGIGVAPNGRVFLEKYSQLREDQRELIQRYMDRLLVLQEDSLKK